MAVPAKLDQVQIGLNRMLSQFDNSPKLRGLFQAYLENVQDVEEMFYQLLTERDIYSAIGAQLDVIGLLVGELRRGRDDEEYRQAILNRVVLNTSDGTPPVVLEILKLLTSADTVGLFEHYPANIHYFASGGVNNSTPQTMDNASAAGVNVRVMFDEGSNSFIPAGLVSEEYLLEVLSGGTSILGVDNTVNAGEDIGVQQVVSFGIGDRSILPYTLDPETATRVNFVGDTQELQNPLCAVL